MFIIGKILIVKIFLNPSEVSPGVKLSDQSLKNFKIVASLVHHIFLLYIKIQVPAFNPVNDEEYQTVKGRKYLKKLGDVISDDLFTKEDMEYAF